MNTKMLLAATLVVSTAGLASAAVVPFTIDPTQSSLALNATVNFPGVGVLGSTPQGFFFPGNVGTSNGDVSSYSGTILADVTGGTIQFVGGSTLDASVTSNANGWAPQVGGGPPGQTFTPLTLTFDPNADYGFSFAGLIWASVNGMIFDITSGVTPLVGTSFASGQGLTVTSGDLSYTDVAGGAYQPPGSSNLIGLPLLNAGANGSLTGPPSARVLTIPVSISQPVLIGGTPVQLLVTGQIVATAVPEPATWALGLLGGVALLACRRFRRGKA